LVFTLRARTSHGQQSETGEASPEIMTDLLIAMTKCGGHAGDYTVP
jgi:hypothetical protein